MTPKAGSASRILHRDDDGLTPGCGPVEQTTRLSDYRTVDGVNVPFQIPNSNPLQSLTLVFKSVEHNVPIDDAMFGKK